MWRSLEVPAAFTHSLSKLAQHLPFEGGKADLGAGSAEPYPHRARDVLGSQGRTTDGALFTNSIMKKSSKDKDSVFLGKCC